MSKRAYFAGGRSVPYSAVLKPHQLKTGDIVQFCSDGCVLAEAVVTEVTNECIAFDRDVEPYAVESMRMRHKPSHSKDQV